jgi:hypothetical protein
MKFVDGDVQTPGPCYVLMPPDELDTIIAALERAEWIEKAARRVRVETFEEFGPTIVVIGLDELAAALAATPEVTS